MTKFNEGSSTGINLGLTKRALIRVLHVDDELDFVKVAKQILEMQGPFQVDTASSVEEAIEKMKKKTFDVIVCDYKIHEKDGLQFLEELRNKGNKIPFIMFTGRSREEVAIEALNLGADQYFTKYGDPETVYGELAHGICKTVERERAYTEAQRMEKLRAKELRRYYKHLEENQKFLENVFAASPDAITVTDLDGIIVECNQATLDMLGYSSKEELIGKNDFAFIAKKDRKKAMGNMKMTLTRGLVKNKEYTLTTKDGREFQAELSASVVKGSSGNPLGFVAITKDITERKRLQEKIVKTEKLATIGQLAASISHDLRNPLGVIKNSTYFLNMKLKGATDEKVMKHLRILEREVNSANIIISDLLDFARKKPPALKQTDLNDVVTGALSSISVPEDIKVTTKLGELPPMLLDQEQIRRVFHNLILNAVQAMPEGGRLTIQTVKHDHSAKITVKDTGVGIPQENLAKLMTPLFSTKAKGVGLGLSICKQIVEGHDGSISAESKVGEGSTFIVKLPVRVKKEIDEPTFTVRLPAQRRVRSEK
jgi:PAS domain S-box-containing protein